MPIMWRTIVEEKLAHLDEKIAEAKKRRLEDEDNGAFPQPSLESSSQYYNEQIHGSRVRVCISPRRKAEAMQLARDISADLRALRKPTINLKAYTTRETEESEREREKNLSGGEINALSLSWIPEMDLGQGDATYSTTQKTNILPAHGLSGPAGPQPCSDGLDLPLSVGDMVTL